MALPFMLPIPRETTLPHPSCSGRVDGFIPLNDELDLSSPTALVHFPKHQIPCVDGNLHQSFYFISPLSPEQDTLLSGPLTPSALTNDFSAAHVLLSRPDLSPPTHFALAACAPCRWDSHTHSPGPKASRS